MDKTKATGKVKKLGKSVGKFGSAAAGLAAGSFIMKKIPAFGPAIVQKLLPGAAGIALAIFIDSKFDNAYARSAAMGLGLAGVVDIAKKTLGAKVPFIDQALPSLSGIGYVQNYGDYPAEYFSQANAARLQGVGDAYQLMGLSNGNAYQLMGTPSANMLN